MEINHFKPHSPDYLLKSYREIREPDTERDEGYSPLHDAIFWAIFSNLKQHCPEYLGAVYARSLFPERLAKEIMRIVEKQIILSEDGTH